MRIWVAVFAIAMTLRAVPPLDDRATVAERVVRLTRDAAWTRVGTIRIAFRTFHPQGMVKIGDTFFVSSVEVPVPTSAMPPGWRLRPGHRRRRRASLQDSTWRASSWPIWTRRRRRLSPWRNRLRRHEHLGAGGRIPAEQPLDRLSRRPVRRCRRPRCSAFADHIGALVHDTDDHTLHGVSWGSRRFYRWTLERDGNVDQCGEPRRAAADDEPVALRGLSGLQVRGDSADAVHRVSPSCGSHPRAAVSAWRPRSRRPADGRPLHQVPVLLWTAERPRHDAQPVWFEPSGRACAPTSCPKTTSRPSTSTTRT